MHARSFARATFTIAGAVACLVAAIAPAQAAANGSWRLYKVYGTGANNIDPPTTNALAVTSPDNAWSVFLGCNWPCTGSSDLDFVGHWNGSKWSPVSRKQIHNLDPSMITASSSTNAWLFGDFPKQRYAGAVHWNGKSWTKRSVPHWAFTINGSGDLDAYFADFSSRDLWIFSEGSYVGQKSAYAARYLNGRWTKSYLPDVVEDTVALSSSDIWVIGRAFSLNGPDVLLHWNGSRWSKTALRAGRPGSPVGLFAVGRQLWLQWQPAKTSAAPFLLRRTGTGWSKVRFPRGYSGFAPVSNGASSVWLTGFAPGTKRVQVFLHWQAGRWTIFRVPNRPYQSGNVDELAAVPGKQSVWAIGNVYGPGAGTVLNRGAIWRYTP
jgi:hypothetical protein